MNRVCLAMRKYLKWANKAVWDISMNPSDFRDKITEVANHYCVSEFHIHELLNTRCNRLLDKEYPFDPYPELLK